MVNNLWVIYKYDSKHTGSRTNVRSNIGKMYEKTRMDGHTDGQTDRRMDRWERYKGLYAQMVEPLVSRKIGHY